MYIKRKINKCIILKRYANYSAFFKTKNKVL